MPILIIIIKVNILSSKIIKKKSPSMFKKNISQGRHKDGAFSLPTILQSGKKSFWCHPHLMIIIMLVIAQGGNCYDDDDNNQRFWWWWQSSVFLLQKTSPTLISLCLWDLYPGGGMGRFQKYRLARKPISNLKKPSWNNKFAAETLPRPQNRKLKAQGCA